MEASEKLNCPPERVFKTLIARAQGSRELIVALVPVNQQLNLKKLGNELGVKKVVMADRKDAERATGYVAGGISALGQKRTLLTVIHVSATSQHSVYISAGRRGLEIELSPQDLQMLCSARFADIC